MLWIHFLYLIRPILSGFSLFVSQRHPPKIYNPLQTWHVSLIRMVRSKCIFCISYSCISTFCLLLLFPGHAPRLWLWGPGRRQIGNLFICLYNVDPAQVLKKLLQNNQFFTKRQYGIFAVKWRIIANVTRQMKKSCLQGETNGSDVETLGSSMA